MLHNQILSDRYALKRQLGQDASRQTWLATDTQTQAAIVVKLLAFNPQMQWDESKLFEREAQVLQSLNHPRIPKYRDYFTIDSLTDSRFPWFGLVQTYIPGESLQERISRGDRFHTADIEKIACELLEILQYLHGLNPPLLHRDIKPSNVIWGEDNQIYLVDFGAVQDQAAKEGATFTVVGTYGYVPIEQFGGRAVPASDLYALGMTLIHLLTGTAPADLPQKNGRVQFADRVSIDAGWVNWLEKLTAPNLSDRFPTAEAALSGLNQRQSIERRSTTPKPSGSKIKMRRSNESIEFLTPARGRAAFGVVQTVGLVVLIGFQIFILGFLVFLILLALTGAASFLGLVLAIGLILTSSYLPAFLRVRLTCDRQWLTLRHEWLGVCYRKERIPLDKIQEFFAGDNLDRLEAALKASTPSFSYHSHQKSLYQAEIQAALVKLTDRLVIQSDDRFYSTNLLALADRLWLRDELLDWLRQSR